MPATVQLITGSGAIEPFSDSLGVDIAVFDFLSVGWLMESDLILGPSYVDLKFAYFYKRPKS
jgi:hypothetical protein